MQKLLLHVCCSPCFANYLNLIKEYSVTLYYYNPNIHPQEEYLKRLDNLKILASKNNFKLIEAEYELEQWYSFISGLEQEPENAKRCLKCFELRLKKSAEYAQKNGYSHFSTTLNLNLFKDLNYINSLGKKLAEEYNLTYLSFPMTKEQRLILKKEADKVVRELNLYKQKYCGCVFSKR